MITHEGVAASLPMLSSTIQIFVSHSAANRELAVAFVAWVEGCLHIPPGKVIRCTSAEGYKMEVGDAGPEQLRADLASCKIVLGIMTDESLESAYVLMELGAGWGLAKRVACFVLPSVQFSRIEGPIAQLNAVLLDSTHDLIDAVDTIAKSVGVEQRAASHQSRATERFVSIVKALQTRTSIEGLGGTEFVDDDESATMLLAEWCAQHIDGVYVCGDVDIDLRLLPGTTARLIAAACPETHTVQVTAKVLKLAERLSGRRR